MKVQVTKALLLNLSLMLPSLSYARANASITCEELQGSEAQVHVLKGNQNVITKENWKSFDVIASLNRSKCHDAISQELIEVNGARLWRFQTGEDHCDGGNTYGSIYSYDLKTPVAHIHDGEITCGPTWREEDKTQNHKCDLAAEALAQKKMKTVGLTFKPTGSTLSLRQPNRYSEIVVTGTLRKQQNGEVSVSILTHLSTCEFGAVSVHHMEL